MPSRGENYDARISRMAEAGQYLHGEADLVDLLLGGRTATIVDAGCGTGRVAMELARRGHRVTGIELDPEMLAVARARAPDLDWRIGDLARPDLDLPRADLVLAAGNVMIFIEPGTEAGVIDTLSRGLVSGGLLVSGFQILPRLSVDRYDELCTAAGLEAVSRWSTWGRDPFTDGDYAVSVHRLGAEQRRIPV